MVLQLYFNNLNDPGKERMLAIHQMLMETFPYAVPSIRYNMPAYAINDQFVYFAAYKHHIGMYPVYDSKLIPEATSYRGKKTKDALHFPYDQELPLNLIRDLVSSITQVHLT